MRRFIIFAAMAAMALTACQQNLNIEEEKPEGTVVFTASTELPSTKTALDASLNVLWQDNDIISIVDGGSRVGQYQTTTGGATTATFTHYGDTPAVQSPFIAWYPTSLMVGSNFILPSTQNYVADNIACNPMYAESSTTNLSFKNLCGIIRLNVSTSMTGKKVSKIVLSADQGMSGAFTIVSNAAVVSGTDGVTLDCGTEGVEIGTTAIPFYIAVPAADYENLAIKVETTDGLEQTKTLKTGEKVTVGRSMITDITLAFNNISPIIVTANSSNLAAQVDAFNAATTDNPTLLLTEDINYSGDIIITRKNGVIDLGGHSLNFGDHWLYLQNDVSGESITIKNGSLGNRIDGLNTPKDYFGTVILEDITLTGEIFTDGHLYELINVNYTYISSPTISRFENYASSPENLSIYPCMAIIRGGKYNCRFHHNGDAWPKGKTTIYGGKFADDPSAIANVTIPEGYSVRANTDADKVTYPYIVEKNAPASSNLVHYWPFNGNTNDAVTSGAINATNDGATLTTDRFGNANSAYLFEGEGDRMNIYPAGNFDAVTSFTFNAWVNTTGTGGSANIVRTDNGNGSWGWCVRFHGDGKIEIWEGTNWAYNTISANAYNDGNWHMVTYVRDVNNLNGILYVDGNEVSSYSMTNGAQSLTPSWENNYHYLGVATPSLEYFVGKMDEVRLYNKALTAEEVSALYLY